MCNVAVAPEHRRKGVARYLIAAAEALASTAGERELFLHLRFKVCAAVCGKVELGPKISS